MPSTKKRINLTIPDNVYEQLRSYMDENGLVNDATACLQLIILQLRAQENTKTIMQLLKNTSLEKLQSIAAEGTIQSKELADRMFSK